MENGLTFEVQNPPLNGNYWQLCLFNEVWGDSIIVGTNVPIDEVITLDSLPEGWSFPLYIDILIYELNVSPYNIVYRVQSAYGPDWPEYKDITIPDYGDYSFDIAELAPPTQDWTPLIGMVLVLGMVAMLVPAMKGVFK